MGTVLLTYGLFISHTGEFTRFLHRRGGAYFVYSLGSPSHAYFFQSSSITDFFFLETIQEDSIFFHLFFYYSTFLRVMFFFGRSTRYAFTKRTPREFPILILFVYLGGLFLLRFSTFIDLLLALETITLASYVLVAFERQNRYSTYASIQYFLVGSIPSARFLLGLAFFYLQGGSLVIQDLDLFFSGRERYSQSLFFSFSQENLVLFNQVFSGDNFKLENEVLASNFGSDVSFFGENRSEAFFSTRVSTTTLSRRGFLFICFNLFFKMTAAPFHF